MRGFRRVFRIIACIAILTATFGEGWAAEVARQIPTPLSGRPGNVFLEGEEVAVTLQGKATRWRVMDVGDGPLSEGEVIDGQDRIPLGRLGVGWYRVEFFDATGQQTRWTSAGVLAALATSVPDDSPVCVDSATAWFARRYQPAEQEHQEILANLAALAGVHWIRDRISWGEMETQRGAFVADTRYDSSAALAAKHDLKVLQVFHSTPDWAVDKTLDGAQAWKRFPRDLRDQYAFCQTMAGRFRGRVRAWEPWNEANIGGFGGHTIDEMCSLQKAAYLGFKSGDPEVRVCWNVYAGSGSPLHSQGIIANETWPYFETYNIHSYSTPDRYVNEYSTARQAACGRPLWITECGIRLTTNDDSPWGDLAQADERRQAEFIARSYATSLFAGVERHFFFILGNYIERGVQFGLLRHDHTPRPGYVALAAVGRLLAGAECLGRVSPTVYAFRARPDGRERDVLVAWGDGAPWPLPADLHVEAVFDHFGRSLEGNLPESSGPAATFVLLPPGESSKLDLESPPQRSPYRTGEPSSVVLQLSLPVRTKRLGSQSHEIEPAKTTELPLFVYNFSSVRVAGTLAVEEAPADWQVQVPAEPIEIDPISRRQVMATVTSPTTGRDLLSGAWVKLRGEFGDGGRPVLAFRFAANPIELRPKEMRPIQSADDTANWEDNIVSQGVMSHQAHGASGVLFEMQFADADPWAYPRLRLPETSVPDNNCDGLALTVQVPQGTGTVRVQFIEQSGAAYLAEAGIDATQREPQRAVVLFRNCKWGSHSNPDLDGKLQPENIRMILVGINSERKSHVKMAVSDLEWVRY